MGESLNLREYARKVHRFFKSPRLTAVVMALLIIIYFLGLVLPQKWMFDSEQAYWVWTEESFLNGILGYIGFTDIYLSPLTILLLGLFFINLLVVTLNRIPVMLKRAYLLGETPSYTSEQLNKKREVKRLSPDIEPPMLIERVKLFFKNKKWYFKKGKERDTYFAVRNRFSPIGFILFHFSFFLCLVGGLMIMYTRFSGQLPLTEGQRFEGDISQFRTIKKEPRILKKLPAVWLYLEKVEPFYEKDIPTELVLNVHVKHYDDIKKEVLKVNEPIKRGSVSILAESIGISPLFIVRGPGGRQIDAAYVSLNVLGGEEDSFRFDTDRRFNFHVKFFPDYMIDNGVEKSKSIELRNPAMHLIVEKEGRTIYDGTIKQGELAKIDMFTVSFDDIRYWAEFLMIREYGKFPLVAGFIIASIGLIMRLVFYQKRLRMAIEYENDKPLLYVDGRSEYFQHSYKDEMNKIVDELGEFLRKT